MRLLSDHTELAEPFPSMLGVIDDGSAVPPDQAGTIIWDNTPLAVKFGAAFGLVTQDKFNSGFTTLSNQGYQLVQASAPPANAFSADALFGAISGLVTNDSDRKKLNDGQSYLTQTVQNLWNKGYYFVNGSTSAAPAGAGYTPPATANTSTPNFVSTLVSPITNLFSTKTSTYQRSGFQASGLKTASRGISQKQKVQLYWLAGIGGVLLIGMVLISSAD